MDLYRHEDDVEWNFTQLELRALLAFIGCTSKPNLAGIALDHEEGVAYATDNCRLVVAKVACTTLHELADGIRTPVLIPKSVLDRVFPLLQSNSDVLRITCRAGDVASIEIVSKTSPTALHPFEFGLSTLEPVLWKPVLERSTDTPPPKSFMISPTFLFDLKHVADAANTPFVTLTHVGGALDLVEASFHEELGVKWCARLAPAQPPDHKP